MDFMIGKPYSFRGFNCWDYVKSIRDQFGLKTNSYSAVNLNDAFDIIEKESSRGSQELTVVDSPKNLDIVITSKKKGDSNNYHCGLFFDSNVLHCSLDLKQVVCESFSEFTKKSDDYTIWR